MNARIFHYSPRPGQSPSETVDLASLNRVRLAQLASEAGIHPAPVERMRSTTLCAKP